MKIAILLPDGVGLRNYIYTNLIPELSELGNEIVLLSVFSDKIIQEISKIHKINIQNVNIPKYKESVIEKFLREIAACARIKRNARVASNKTIRYFFRKKQKDFPSWLFYEFVIFLSWIFSRSISIISIIENLHLKLIKTESFEVLLKEHNISKIFCTHQRVISALPMIEAAKKCNIRSYTVIYSWDNLPKGRLPIRPDYYMVWSEYMKEEFELFYPDIEKDKVLVTGTPQFEFYSNKKNFISREQFCKTHGINITKKIICYSGDDTLTSPYDPQYLDDLAQTIQSLDKEGKTAILLRRCPVDLSNRYKTIIDKYPGLIFVSDPKWEKDNENGWVGLYPTIDDVQLLCNVAYHCDAVYNVGSTMAFDFCMFNHPAYYINYDQPNSTKWSVKTIYKLQHFRSMPSRSCVLWVNSKEYLKLLMQDFISSNKENIPTAREWYGIINSGATNEIPSKKIAQLLNS